MGHRNVAGSALCGAALSDNRGRDNSKNVKGPLWRSKNSKTATHTTLQGKRVQRAAIESK